jgi:hypothetical protein
MFHVKFIVTYSHMVQMTFETGPDFTSEMANSWRLGGYCKVPGIEHIYPRTKLPILEVGFSRQGELCVHF